MPYKAEQQGDNWTVVNEGTGDVKATYEPPDAEEKAKRQIRILEEMERENG
jgi:hypothetical protein